MEKYTYENWLNGDVVLKYTSCYWNTNTQNEPITIDWESFTESDVSKIKEKQEQIFEEKAEELKNKFKDLFLKGYENSKMKEKLLIDEMKQCFNIMFGEIPNAETITAGHWDTRYENLDLQAMQRYIKNVLERGIKDEKYYIHSPNCQYQDKTKIPSKIYAQAVFDYYNWLELFNKTSFNNESNSVIDLNKNPYPILFKNALAYDLFIELKNLTVNTKTVIADYSFIFHKMKKKGYIIEYVKHLTFINFLNDKFDAKLDINKFPFKDQNSKNVVFSTLLNKYKPQIDTNP